MNAYDNDEYRLKLLTKTIQEYEGNTISLRNLVDGISSILGSLDSIDKKAMLFMMDHWETLEQVYAFARHREESEDPSRQSDDPLLTIEEQRMIDDAIENISNIANTDSKT